MKNYFRFFWIALAASIILLMIVGGPVSAARELPSKDERLVLKQVALFNNGVGYFQLGGEVMAGEEIRLHVKHNQMNDLLKSLTVINLSGGQVNSIVYDNDKTSSQKLDEFNFHLEKEQGLPQILRQLQGSEIEVITGSTAVPGTIMGVEKRNIQEGKGLVPHFFLTIMDPNHQMRSFDTREITGTKLVDEKLNRDLSRYLAILFQKHQTDGKSITITPTGQGPQELLVSYIAEVPVWKATYRIVLPDLNKGEKPFLQGWAIVDNVTGEDWQNVELSLVSGLPVSFVQELYAPRFKKRPELKMEDENAVPPPGPGSRHVRQPDADGYAFKPQGQSRNSQKKRHGRELSRDTRYGTKHAGVGSPNRHSRSGRHV